MGKEDKMIAKELARRILVESFSRRRGFIGMPELPEEILESLLKEVRNEVRGLIRVGLAKGPRKGLWWAVKPQAQGRH